MKKISELRDWRGKYARYTQLELSDRAYKQYDKTLELFFSHFPKARRLSDISRVDVYDYERMREREGAKPADISREVRAVSAFYNWVIPASGLPLINPAAKVIRINWP